MKRKGILILAAAFLTVLLLSRGALPAYAAQTNGLRGGINIQKTDILGKGLPGAAYQIAREATQTELQDSAVAKRLLKTGEQTLTVVYVPFWDSREMTGEKTLEAVTDSSGYAAVYGLPYGTYYLVESIAPEGYDQMEAPVRITVNKYSHLTAADDIRDDAGSVIDNTLHIVTIRYHLPDTGKAASARITFALTGLTISLGVLVFLIRVRKRYLV